jgi:hypothetical protein
MMDCSLEESTTDLNGGDLSALWDHPTSKFIVSLVHFFRCHHACVLVCIVRGVLKKPQRKSSQAHHIWREPKKRTPSIPRLQQMMIQIATEPYQGQSLDSTHNYDRVLQFISIKDTRTNQSSNASNRPRTMVLDACQPTDVGGG